MAGQRLRKLEASEALDIVHYLFEDDFAPKWEQDAEVKSKFREVVYETMYKSKYKYSVSGDKKRTQRFGSFDADGMPEFDLPSGTTEVKPYIPPTPEEDLHSILGGPLGG